MPVSTFDAVDRSDGSVLGSFPMCGDAEVRAALLLAREASPAWASASVGARCRMLRSWRGELWRSSARLAELLHREAGLGFDDAMLEVLQTVEHLRWVEGHASGALASTSVSHGLLSPELGATSTWVPEGVVGVVASGRPSLYAAASAVACALAAGNAVVVQPSGRLTATLAAYVEAFAVAHPDAPAGILQVLTGDDATAVTLAGTPLDRVCFLGSPVAGVRVSTAAARALVPVTVVPVVAPVTLVAPDADLDAAAAAVAELARSGRGDDEPGPEVFVAPSVLDDFTEALRLAGAGSTARRGVLARAMGRRTGPAELAAPVGAVRVQSAPGFEVLVERLQGHPSAQVAVHSARHGRHLAELLTAAEITVNVPAATAGELPRAALGSRGYGPFAGENGLRTFARTRTTTAKRRLPVPVAPVELLLATPAGRVATRLLLHVRHSLD
ncbi:aldehyde dehydrogenase family protein [Nocardioides sp.]|uniref:aldehyde dehydrogenase family protein n=1 Tax=Nocardioides sp. TaxID=35761 RepID=UPI002725D778|nr:aldehyde dehydrogenase family protein [Nocardioides sp.]MDO9457483.1 aldehyde dehydrogenase family protein [Nocardioides sp.]